MNIFKSIREDIINSLKELIEEGFLPEDTNIDHVTAEPPRDASHGDISTNAAMVVAKKAGKKPREVAEKILDKLRDNEKIRAMDIAGPGFINLCLKENIWHGLVKEVLEDGNSYGNSDLGHRQKINIEYVSANPTGPIHIGHARNAIIGDSLATLLIKSGYRVTKEFYVNDAGAQVDILARSVYLRYCEAIGENIGEIPEGLYPGDYLKPVGEAFLEEHGKKYHKTDESLWFPVIKEFAIEAMMALIKSDLLELGVEQDVFASEKAIAESNAIEKAYKVLDDKGLIYQGTLPPPKSKKANLDDWEPVELTLFKSSEFGDESDRPLKKADGSWAYIMPDIGYHYDKIQRGFYNIINVLGADHVGYQKRLQAAISALTDGKANLSIVLYELVNLYKDGEVVQMSKRSGNFVTAKEVIDAVGKDVIRFTMLTRKAEAVLDFDLKKVTEQSKDNPVFYVQYAHARIHSVLRKVADEMPEAIKEDIENVSVEDLSGLIHVNELALIRSISNWPRTVEAAAASLEPHRVAFYLQDLASELHTLWNIGQEDDSLRFIQHDDVELTRARLALIKACAITLASGMNVIGVEPVMSM